MAHAHSYVIETFADFGLIGIAVSAWPCSSSGEPRSGARWPRGAEGVTHSPRAHRPDHDARGRRDLRRLLGDRLDVVRPGRHRSGAGVRRLAGRARTAARSRPAQGRTGPRTASAAPPPRAHRRRDRRRGRRPDRRLVRLAAAALLRPGVRRDQRHDPGRRARRAGRRPRAPPTAIPCRSTRCGSCRRSTRRWATRPRAAPSSSRRPRSSRPTRRPGSSSARSISRPTARSSPWPSSRPRCGSIRTVAAHPPAHLTRPRARRPQGPRLPHRARSRLRLSSGGPSTARTSTSREAELVQQRLERPPRVQVQVIPQRLREPSPRRGARRRRRPCDGVVTSSLPLGTSTRRTSESQRAVSATCSITSLAHTSSNELSSNGSGPSNGTSRKSSPGCRGACPLERSLRDVDPDRAARPRRPAPR